MQVFSARLSAAAVLADAFSVFPAGGFKVLPTIEEAVDCLLRGAEEEFRVFADVSSLAAGEGGARIAAEAAFLREERRDAVIDQNRGLHEPGGAAILQTDHPSGEPLQGNARVRSQALLSSANCCRSRGASYERFPAAFQEADNSR